MVKETGQKPKTQGELTILERFSHEPMVKLKELLTSDVVRKYICPAATEKEIFLFLAISKSYQLNPFKREIHMVKYGNNPAQTVVGFETYLKRADRCKDYAGFKAWTEPADEKTPKKAFVKIHRKNWEIPLEHEVLFDEYAQWTTDQKTGERRLNKFWGEKSHTMIKKVVISQGFRLAFPDEMGGLPYIPEEIRLEDAELISPSFKVEATDTMQIPSNVNESKTQPADNAPVQTNGAPTTKPENGDNAKPNQLKIIRSCAKNKGISEANLCEQFKVAKLEDLPSIKVNEALKIIADIE